MKKVWKDLPYYDKIIFNYIVKPINWSVTVKYDLQNKKIFDGVELCSVSAEGFKTACASLSFVMPLGEKASLYALVPNVLTRSCKDYPDVTSIEKKLALLYGAEVIVDVGKIGENQVLKIEVSCIDDRFSIDSESITNECLKLLFKMVFEPRLENGVFCSDDVESEKRLLAERLIAENSDKRAYAKNRCTQIMFENELYGIHRYGSVSDIEKITPESLYEAYNEVLRNSKILACVSGGSFSNVEELLGKYLSKRNRKIELNETLYVEECEDVKYVKEQEAVKQGKLVMGFRLGMKSEDDNYAARRVMVDLFGGSPHSKLFTVVREKMSLCYYCSAMMFRQKGVMLVQSGIESYNEEKAKNAILAQLEDIKNGNFSDDDIASSVKSLEDGFRSVSDSAESVASWFTSQVCAKEFLYPEDFIEQFKKVTREDIIEAAKAVTLDTVFMLEGTAEGGVEE